MADRKAVLTGGCQCGAVRYALYAPPSKVGICHCRMCQKAVAGPFGVFAVVDAADFAWTRGAPASWQSSSKAFRDFCGRCGTPLAFRPIAKPLMELLAGSLDRPEQAAPTYEVGTEGRLAWLAGLAALPGRTTVENVGAGAAAAIVSFQHPDHDTPDGWQPAAKRA